jgi:hypothetical protein
MQRLCLRLESSEAHRATAQYHCVQPVISGRRRVLILELWAGPERRCPHRCLTPPCTKCTDAPTGFRAGQVGP